MATLTLITHVYNAQAAVDHQVGLWKRFAPQLLQHLRFLVIDDHSDEPLRIDPGPLDLRLLRIDDDIDWNMPACRNLAAIQASTDWLLYFDIDNVASQADVARLVLALPRLDPTRLTVFRRVQNGVDVDPHINSFLIRREGFWRAGGYDEDFCGHYGFEDVLFRMMWRQHVGGEVLLTDIAFEQMNLRTSGLDRDTTRNQALIQQRAAAGFPKPRAFVRCAWHEVALPAPAAVPAPAAEPAGAAEPATEAVATTAEV